MPPNEVLEGAPEASPPESGAVGSNCCCGWVESSSHRDEDNDPGGGESVLDSVRLLRYHPLMNEHQFVKVGPAVEHEEARSMPFRPEIVFLRGEVSANPSVSGSATITEAPDTCSGHGAVTDPTVTVRTDLIEEKISPEGLRYVWVESRDGQGNIIDFDIHHLG